GRELAVDEGVDGADGHGRPAWQCRAGTILSGRSRAGNVTGRRYSGLTSQSRPSRRTSSARASPVPTATSTVPLPDPSVVYAEIATASRSPSQADAGTTSRPDPASSCRRAGSGSAP